MTITVNTLAYPAGDTLCQGEYYAPSSADGLLPVILVCHAWDGLNDEVRDKARKLADEGYIAFAIDIHGGGKTMTDRAELMATLSPYLDDRSLLLQRVQGAANAAKDIPGADLSRMGAMGYCFGGMAVLDLARAGVGDVKAVVTFHGALAGNTLHNPATMSSKILVLHGEEDPLVPPEQVAAFKQEMNAKQVDWQLHAYSHTMHAFTRPQANDRAAGTVYNSVADRRSWQAMLNFFSEVL